MMILGFIFLHPTLTLANENEHQERMALYKKTEAVLSVPWYYLAAMDQYERNIQKEDADDTQIALQFDPVLWYGPGNHLHLKENNFVSMFQGIGMDGEDRKSTRLNSSHVAISYAVFCLKKKS